ncbi:MAG: hypothetical protein AAGA40_13565, partial [Cyanobacteria bacterium P01_E01_bin.45]
SFFIDLYSNFDNFWQYLYSFLLQSFGTLTTSPTYYWIATGVSVPKLCSRNEYKYCQKLSKLEYKSMKKELQATNQTSQTTSCIY